MSKKSFLVYMNDVDDVLSGDCYIVLASGVDEALHKAKEKYKSVTETTPRENITNKTFTFGYDKNGVSELFLTDNF